MMAAQSTHDTLCGSIFLEPTQAHDDRGRVALMFLCRQAVTQDTLIGVVLSLAEVKEMVNEMLQQNRDYPPQFEHFGV